jgi:isocitrate/isopropylmalate dehydrogenase
VLSAAMMLDFLGEGEAAERIRTACRKAPTDGTTDHIATAIEEAL